MSFDYSFTRLCSYVYASAPALFMLGAAVFLLWLDRRRRHREAAELRARRKREEEHEQRKIGERIRRELACELPLPKSDIAPAFGQPVRKATGLFSGCEAQEILAK
ncbi:MAG: hypothetical protein IJH37_05095 [Clostridia bacterium]|nr:hypothetical protein [Clostridia bacterium]